jgi:hypothetical protein
MDTSEHEPLRKLPETSSLADVIAKVNELVDLLNDMWYSDTAVYPEEK